ncbi:MAG: hypothetical protein A2X94_09800 [Bdellovibrionales bacterium GWB1_55_8]|nr:MAG: hypothetical protein A2X94_09800 [Bdellovibrionales bacterium GWB1_55_8]
MSLLRSAFGTTWILPLPASWRRATSQLVSELEAAGCVIEPPRAGTFRILVPGADSVLLDHFDGRIRSVIHALFSDRIQMSLHEQDRKVAIELFYWSPGQIMIHGALVLFFALDLAISTRVDGVQPAKFVAALVVLNSLPAIHWAWQGRRFQRYFLERGFQQLRNDH